MSEERKVNFLKEAEEAYKDKCCQDADASIVGEPYENNRAKNTTESWDDKPVTSLRERIHLQRHRAQVESRRADQLSELEYLLDKHPEIARILDLLDVVKR